jgi:hypothetical protein
MMVGRLYRWTIARFLTGDFLQVRLSSVSWTLIVAFSVGLVCINLFSAWLLYAADSATFRADDSAVGWMSSRTRYRIMATTRRRIRVAWVVLLMLALLVGFVNLAGALVMEGPLLRLPACCCPVQRPLRRVLPGTWRA